MIEDTPTDEIDDSSGQAGRGQALPVVHWTALPTLNLKTFVSEGANPVDVMVQDLPSPKSKRSYVSRLEHIARLLPLPMTARTVPWQQLRYAHVVAIKDALTGAGLSAASVNATLSALRKVSKTCVHLNLMSRDDMLSIQDVKMLKASRLPAGREVRIGELEAMIRMCREDPLTAAGWRDITLMGFLYICGLRRFEVAAIDIGHLDLDEARLSVIGKGNKERYAYLDPGTMAALDQWLSHRQGDEGPLFLPVNKSGKVQFTGRISDQTVYNVIKKRQRQAGVGACAPHDFRRTFGTELLRQGIDLPTVQRLMGHADPATTARYDVRKWEEDRAATRGLHLPLSDI